MPHGFHRFVSFLRGCVLARQWNAEAWSEEEGPALNPNGILDLQAWLVWALAESLHPGRPAGLAVWQAGRDRKDRKEL